MNKYFLTILLLVFVICIPAGAQNLQSYQAEDALFFKAKIETEHAGFTGSGYVNFDNEPGGWIEWPIFLAEADSQTIFIYFANGSTGSREMHLEINQAPNPIVLSFQSTGAWTTWAADSVRIFLNAGENLIRLTGISAEGGPNLDRLDVSGAPGTIFYDFFLQIMGNGQVDVNPPGERFAAGSVVELRALPDPGWIFFGWRGDTSGTENPVSLVMNSRKSVTAIFTTEFDSAYQFEDSPVGFASVNSLDQAGTTGGAGGDTVIVRTGDALFEILDARRDSRFEKNHPPLVILIEGKLLWNTKEMLDVKETYDLSILGNGTDAQIEGFGLNIFRSHNIIVRNIEFRDAPDDAINVINALSHHIWIDHCTFSDDPASDPSGNNHDGLVDIKDGASFVTVSWNHFYNHHKTCLLGHSDNNAAADSGRLKTTYHHNWFDNTNSRHPRVRFGEVHVYNNFFDNSRGGMSYGVASTMEADVVVEANYFKSVAHPTYVGYGDSGPGDLNEQNNFYENCGAPEIRGTAFEPETYYSYQPDHPLQLPGLLFKYCGSGKLSQPETAVEARTPEIFPGKLQLFANFPNPFNPATTIQFSLSHATRATVTILDVTGREVAQLTAGYLAAGVHRLEWNAAAFASGLYFCRIQANEFAASIKILLLR